MKKVLSIIIGILIIFWVVFVYARIMKWTARKLSNVSTSVSCQNTNGIWNKKHNECEYIDKGWCDKWSWTFDECGSACRHSTGDICTLQCIPYCSFKESELE